MPLFSRHELPSPVGPAPSSQSLRDLAKHLPPTLYMGTSSWSFPGWDGFVYDRKTSKNVLARYGLAAYASHPLFRAVGIDRTYYGPISSEELAGYASSVPLDFTFLVKGHSLLTNPFSRDGHFVPNPMFLDARYARDEMILPMLQGLGERENVLLFQFPPIGASGMRALGGPDAFLERLHGFLGSLPDGLYYAVELRNDELLTNVYADALRATGALHAYNVHPTMPPISVQSRHVRPASMSPVVIRWMLHRHRGYEEALEAFSPFDRIVDEDNATRASIATLIEEASSSGRRVLVIANNKAEGSAPRSLLRLAELLTENKRSSKR